MSREAAILSGALSVIFVLLLFFRLLSVPKERKTIIGHIFDKIPVDLVIILTIMFVCFPSLYMSQLMLDPGNFSVVPVILLITFVCLIPGVSLVIRYHLSNRP